MARQRPDAEGPDDVTIAHVANGAWAGGAASCSPLIPSGTGAGHAMVLFVGAKPPDTASSPGTIDTPSGWTKLGQVSNGTTPPGAGGSGSVQVAAFVREWQSGDASPTVTLSGTTNVIFGRIASFSKTGATWSFAGSAGTDASGNTDVDAAMAADIGIAAGDMLAAGHIIANSTISFSAPAIQATGATIGSATQDAGSTTTGADAAMATQYASVTAGPATAAARVRWTLSANAGGSAVLVRLRETAAPSTADGVTLPATTSLVSGAATGAAAASGATIAAAGALMPGAATGDAVAVGSTVSAAASLITGAASGASEATAGSVLLTAQASISAGDAAGDAEASGATAIATAGLTTGPATGNAAATGQMLEAALALLPGSAAGGGASTALGATWTATGALIAGDAVGEATAGAAVIEAGTIFVPGLAIASGGEAVASGALFDVLALFVPGGATGGAIRRGAFAGEDDLSAFFDPDETELITRQRDGAENLSFQAFTGKADEDALDGYVLLVQRQLHFAATDVRNDDTLIFDGAAHRVLDVRRVNDGAEMTAWVGGGVPL